LNEGPEISENIDFVDIYQKKNQTEEVIHYLEMLGGDKKDIFLLRIWDEMSYEEIAEIVGKSVENCRQEFSRTLKKVAEKFKNFA
jgi:RNA polymerase sigma-70 factor (ECF subfamily)